MSEDIAQAATDDQNTGAFRYGDALTISEESYGHVDLDHKITLICDSHRTFTARLTIRRDRKNKRIPCPECGRMVTVYVRGSRQ